MVRDSSYQTAPLSSGGMDWNLTDGVLDPQGDRG
jgi:hypothetical protein